MKNPNGNDKYHGSKKETTIMMADVKMILLMMLMTVISGNTVATMKCNVTAAVDEDDEVDDNE